jgi:hypothetical protein
VPIYLRKGFAFPLRVTFFGGYAAEAEAQPPFSFDVFGKAQLFRK